MNRAATRPDNAWDNLAAIDELDSARHNAAAAVASQEHSAGSARMELTDVRQRITVQQARLDDVAARAHRPPPAVEPPRPTGRTRRCSSPQRDGSDARRESGSDGGAGRT